MSSYGECCGVTAGRNTLWLASIGLGLISLPATATTIDLSSPKMTTLGYQTYAYYDLIVRNQNVAEEGPPLAANTSTTLSRDLGAINFNGDTLPGMKAYAFADVGQIKTLARIGGVMSSTGNPGAADFQANAYAGFYANVVFDTGTPGQAGMATFTISLDGIMDNRPTTGPTPQYAAVSGGESWILRSRVGGPCPASIGWCYASLDNPGPSSQSVQQTFLYTLSFVSGVPLQIGLEVESVAGARALSNGYVYGLSDFPHTLKWGGLVSATAGGTDITSTLQSGGGFDFVSPPSVPEPASWVLMIGGFGVVGAAMRRREGRWASAWTN